MLDFIAQMIGSRPIEMIAVFCGLVNVSLIIRRSIWNYPFGFLMVVLYAKIFYDYQLYSDALLQIYFFLSSFMGSTIGLREELTMEESLSSTYQGNNMLFTYLLPLSAG